MANLVLVCEDEDQVRAVLGRLIRQFGYDCRLAANDQELFALLSSLTPDDRIAVIMDRVPYGRSATEYVKRALSEVEFVLAGFTILSGTATEEDREEFEDILGRSVERLEKPVTRHPIGDFLHRSFK